MSTVFSFGTGPWDPSHRFETSWLLRPYVLFAFRAVFALYIFFVRFFILGFECTHALYGGCTAADQDFSYFTVLCYWGMGFYFLFASIHTFTYARWGTPLLDKWPRPLQALHSLFYTTIVTFPFLVTIVYWSLIYTNPWFPLVFNAWSNISEHALNSLFALFELFITRTAPLPWIHMLWLVVLLALYLGVAYITVASEHFYVYTFLNPATSGSGMVAAYIFGILAAALVIYLIAKGLIYLRIWITETKLHMGGKFASQPAQQNDVEMQDGRKN